MQFINPKTDFAFKKIFGSEENKQVLISFLNAMLYEGNPTIQDLRILNPYVAPRIRGMKDTYLDVKAQLDNQSFVIIEMQVLNVEGFEKRILYNAAKSFSTQLGIGESYTLLNPVIALTITDFVIFPHIEKIISRFILKEKDFLVDYLVHDIELVFVELPKFTKSLEQLADLTDRWLFFLKNAPDLETVPTDMSNIPEFQQAFQAANHAILTPEELDEIERREIFIHDQRNAIIKATKLGQEYGLQKGRQEGRQEGLQQGIQQGVQQGLQQGREEGDRQARLTIAQELLKTLDLQTVCQITQLSPEDLSSEFGVWGSEEH
jgi:predicted transposase/invertase (TIGR01784 family)